MSLLRLRTAPFILIEDDKRKNILLLLHELVQNERNNLYIFCYEQPQTFWQSALHGKHVSCFEEYDIENVEKYTNSRCSIIVDSVNQMVLSLGWSETLKQLLHLKKNHNVAQLIVILHKDCLSHSSKLLTHLNHVASAIISYDNEQHSKVFIQVKKSGKITKSEEMLSYDSKTSTLKSTPIIKDLKKPEEPEQPSPGSLSTFKIEVEQTDKIEKYRLKLPYMSKINEGGQVFYEPDAVDDWDDEDPDDDLDI